MGRLATVVSGVLLVGVWLSPSESGACSTLLPAPALSGLPAQGETEVPTDAVPLYDGVAAHMSFPGATALRAGDAPQLTLTAADGTTIPVTATLTHLSWAQLQPQSPLAANTTYTLSGSWLDAFDPQSTISLSLSFTTGSGALAAIPSAPTASMQRYAWNQGSGVSDCAPNSHGNCIFWPSGTTLEAVYSSPTWDGGFLNEPYFFGGPFLDTGLDSPNTPFTCVDLRTRAENGTLSDPQRLCASDFPVTQYSSISSVTCNAEGLTVDGQVATSCDVMGTPGRARSPAGSWPVLLFLPVGWALRRVASRRPS